MVKNFILILFLFSCLFCDAQKFDSQGSLKHYVAGVVIGYTTTRIVFYRTKNISASAGMAILTGTFAGAGKEFIYDKSLKLGTPSFDDAWNTETGTFLGLMVAGFQITYILK